MSLSSINYKLKCSPVSAPERQTRQGPLYKTVRTPTDKSVWGKLFQTVENVSLTCNYFSKLVFSPKPWNDHTSPAVTLPVTLCVNYDTKCWFVRTSLRSEIWRDMKKQKCHLGGAWRIPALGYGVGWGHVTYQRTYWLDTWTRIRPCILVSWFYVSSPFGSNINKQKTQIDKMHVDNFQGRHFCRKNKTCGNAPQHCTGLVEWHIFWWCCTIGY